MNCYCSSAKIKMRFSDRIFNNTIFGMIWQKHVNDFVVAVHNYSNYNGSVPS